MSDTGRKSQFLKALMELRQLVLSGEFAPGERLSEVALSEKIGISRTPLREALGRLEEEGLVERGEKGGCRVRSFAFEDISDAIELRGVIEGTAARLAAERGASDEGLAACRTVLDAIDTALGATEADIDFDLYADLNDEYHSLLAGLAGSETIARECERVARRPLAAPSAFLQGQANMPEIRRSLYLAQTQHRAILDAIVNREGARAEALAREHARLARKNLVHALDEGSRLIDAIPGLALVAR